LFAAATISKLCYGIAESPCPKPNNRGQQHLGARTPKETAPSTSTTDGHSTFRWHPATKNGNRPPAIREKQLKARSIIDHQLQRLPALRAGCTVCNGNPQICREGTPTHDRHPDCAAFTETGMVQQLPNVVAPGDKRQPWETAA